MPRKPQEVYYLDVTKKPGAKDAVHSSSWYVEQYGKLKAENGKLKEKVAFKSRKSVVWCVKTACYYYGESPSDEIACDVKLFASEEAAVRELNRAIREDWTSEIEIDGETKSLADMRGMQQDEDSRKYSDWYYSEDGKLAWRLCDGSFSYRGEVVKLEVPS